MDKNIDLKDGNIVKVNNNGRSIIIDKGYLQNGEISKVLTMSMSDDFGFEAYTFLDDEILVNFYNGLKDDSNTNKFIITIINIMRDGRSKIDREGLDTKYRLVKFFRDVEKELLYEKEIDGEER